MTTTLVPPPDKIAFAQCFNRLAKAKRAKDIDAADLQIYFDTLRAFPLWAIEAAALALQRLPTFGFPTTDVWVTAADAEVQRRLRDTLTRGRAWQIECEACGDSGWTEDHCTAVARCGRPFCARLGETHAHTYYAICLCRPHNRTYQRQTAANRMGRHADVT